MEIWGVKMIKSKMQTLLDSAVAKYVANNSRSQDMSEQAKESLPGGNTRTGAYMHPFPVYIDRGEGGLLSWPGRSSFIRFHQ